MRYLKAIAQNRSGKCKADTVILHFYENHDGGPDKLSHEALAVDMNADGAVDVQCAGDINHDGQCNIRDKQLLKEFTNAFLKLNWFNPGESAQRSLSVFVDHYGKNRLPNAVKLEFHDAGGSSRKESLAYGAAAYDADGNGVLESFSNSDVNRNGVADKADKEWMRALGASFLAMQWYESLPSEVNQSCVDKASTTS